MFLLEESDSQKAKQATLIEGMGRIPLKCPSRGRVDGVPRKVPGANFSASGTVRHGIGAPSVW